MVREVAADPQLVESDPVVRYLPLAHQPMDRRGGFRQARGVAHHDLEHAPVVGDQNASAVAADSLGQVASDPPGVVDGMSRRDLLPLLSAVVMQPRGIDQYFGGDVGDEGVDVRPHPERALGVLAVHALQPGLVGQTEWALFQVGVRRLGAGNPDGVDGQARGPAGLALRPLESLPPNGRKAPSRHRLISLKVTLPSTICDGPVMMHSEFGLVSNHQSTMPAIQKSLPTMLPE